MPFSDEQMTVVEKLQAEGTVENLIAICSTWTADKRAEFYAALMEKNKAWFIALPKNGWDLARLFDHYRHSSDIMSALCLLFVDMPKRTLIQESHVHWR